MPAVPILAVARGLRVTPRPEITIYPYFHCSSFGVELMFAALQRIRIKRLHRI
jgi:hypothetical protein